MTGPIGQESYTGPAAKLPSEGWEYYDAYLANMSGSATASLRLAGGAWKTADFASKLNPATGKDAPCVTALLAGPTAASAPVAAIAVPGAVGDIVDVEVRLDAGSERIILQGASIEIVEAV